MKLYFYLFYDVKIITIHGKINSTSINNLQILYFKLNILIIYISALFISRVQKLIMIYKIILISLVV